MLAACCREAYPRSGAPDREPELRRTAARGLRFHSSLPPGHQERERLTDPIGGSVPPEQIADGGSGHTALACKDQRAPDFIGDRIAEGISKDANGGGFAVVLDGDGSIEVLESYLSLALSWTIEQGINQRQPDDLCLSPRGNRPQQSGLLC